MRKFITPALIMMALSAAAWAQTSVNETKAAAPDGDVVIKNPIGPTRIIGWDNPEVKVEGTLERRVIRLDFTVSGSRTDIEVIIPDRGKEREARLTIHIPKASRLDATAISGGIDVENTVGPLKLTSVSGHVGVKAVAPSVEFEVTSGRFEFEGKTPSLEGTAVSGGIKVKGAEGEVDLEAVSGSISVQGGSFDRVKLEVTSGGIDFAGALSPRARVDMSTISGGIRLTVQEDVSAEFDISTFSGGIDNSIGPESSKRSQFGPGRVLEFTAGGGGADVKVTTMSGGVTLDTR